MKLSLKELKKLMDSTYISCNTQFGKKAFWYSGWYCCKLYDQDCFFRVGQSYGKKVLIEVESENDITLYEVGKYSQTTSKQVTQFFNQVSIADRREFIDPDFEWRSKYA